MHTSWGDVCLGVWGYGGVYAIIALSCPCREERLIGRCVAPLPPAPHVKKGGAVGAMPPSPLSLKTRGVGGGALGGGGSHTGTGPGRPPGGAQQVGTTNRPNHRTPTNRQNKSATFRNPTNRQNKSAKSAEFSRRFWVEGLAVRSRISWDTCKPHAQHQRPVDLRTGCSMRPKDAVGGQPLLPGVTTSGFVALALWFVLPVSSMSVVGTTGGGFYCWGLKLQTMRMRS